MGIAHVAWCTAWIANHVLAQPFSSASLEVLVSTPGEIIEGHPEQRWFHSDCATWALSSMQRRLTSLARIPRRGAGRMGRQSLVYNGI